jgi:hypothetical protein
MNNEEKKRKIREWQMSNYVHPLTCGTDKCTYNLRPVEIEDKVILKCLACDYTQEHIPEIVFRTDIKKLNKSMKKMINNMKEDKEKDLTK